jgi:hypothetical protein
MAGWGGEQMAMDFVHNKQLSPYSQRHSVIETWLFRKAKHYRSHLVKPSYTLRIVDTPEEFASAF